MRLVLFAAAFVGLFFAGARPARAQAFRTGPEGLGAGRLGAGEQQADEGGREQDESHGAIL